MVLGQLAGLVEVAESPEGFEGAVIVVGGVEAVELLQGLPAGFEAGVGVEQLVEAGAVGVGEGVASAQQREPGSEHLGVEGGLDAVGLLVAVVASAGAVGLAGLDGGPRALGVGGFGEDDLRSGVLAGSPRVSFLDY